MFKIRLVVIFMLGAIQPVLAQAESKPIFNATSLVNRDWACTYTISKKHYNRNSSSFANNTSRYGGSRRYTTRYRAPQSSTYQSTVSTLISLKQTENWDQGKVWLLKMTENGEGKNQFKYEAWKGFYHFYGDADDSDNLILNLGFVRKYNGHKNSDQISWKLATDYEKKGARIDIPLDERTVPANRITLSVVKGFFVDSQGKPTTRRYEPYGFLQKLSGMGDVMDVDSTGFIDLGKTVEMTDSATSTILAKYQLNQSLPTGCRLHGK